MKAQAQPAYNDIDNLEEKHELALQELNRLNDKQTEFEKQKASITFHIDHKTYNEKLKDAGYKKVGENITENLYFETWLNTHALVILQMDINGKSIMVFRQINFAIPNDVINTLAELDGKPKVLHTKEKREVTRLTRFSDFILGINDIFYGRSQ